LLVKHSRVKVFILNNNNWSSISENLGLNTTENINFFIFDRKGKYGYDQMKTGFLHSKYFNKNFRFKNKRKLFLGCPFKG
jgi:hypothetical protein